MNFDDMTLADAPDWDGLERDVVERIRTLRMCWHGLPKGPGNDEIRGQVILPAVALLAEFCACVSEESPDEDNPF